MARKTDKERNAVDDRVFMESIADIIGEYDSGKVAVLEKISERCAEKGYPLDKNRLNNCVQRLKSHSMLSSDWMRVRDDNFMVVDGERKRTVPVIRGYVLTVLGWHEIGKTDIV